MRMMMTTNSKRTMQMPVKYMQMLKRPRIYRKNHEKGSETVNFDNQEKQARCRAQVAIWYENEGFERIQAIRKTLESENRNCFSVNREGICSISIGKRKYRRVGILKGYPFGQTEVIREKLKKDGFITSMGCNNYLWISW